jgi:signal transduction histidine kinase
VKQRRRSEASPGSDERDHIRRAFLGLALCHELKQPLHSLNLNIELLSKRVGKVSAASPEVGDLSGPMGALGRVVDRINDCLDAFASRSMPDVVPPAARTLQPLLEESVERVRDRAKHAGVQMLLRASQLPEVPVNGEQIAVALDALLDNAIRASSKSDEVVVSAEISEDDVRIEVVDHGTGMTPDVARRAVEIGYSTWGGSGIGLTIAKFITYHHAGGFQVATTPGLGTTVAMILPVTDLRE